MDNLQETKELALQEATLLKGNLTKREIGGLDKYFFAPSNPHYCIYGLATGNCNSARARELINICCNKVYVPKDHGAGRNLNGNPNEMTHVETTVRFSYYSSPIEMLILDRYKGRKYGEAIIDFLKGETETLNFDN